MIDLNHVAHILGLCQQPVDTVGGGGAHVLVKYSLKIKCTLIYKILFQLDMKSTIFILLSVGAIHLLLGKDSWKGGHNPPPQKKKITLKMCPCQFLNV